MDLHDVYRAALAQAVVEAGSVMTLRVGDERLHHCGCGYETELIEVMAIHQVRVHCFLQRELREVAFNSPRLVAYRNGEAMVVDYFEADSPDGPWTPAPGGVVRKRYAQIRERR